MSVGRLVNLLVMITLIEMMLVIGLRVTFAGILVTIANWRVIARAILANYVLVPAVAIILLLLFQAAPMVAAGFLVLAACPGAPFGPPFARMAHADVPAAVGLMVVLAGSSAILSPMLLAVLLPWLSDGGAVRIELADLVGTMLITQLLPLLGGLLVNHWRPQLAARLLGPLGRAGAILNVSVAGLILFTQFGMLAQIKLIGFAGMLGLLAASLAIGWLAGGPDVESRKTMALTTALRNAGVGLVIATGAAFAGTPVASAVLAYAIVAVFGSLLVALWWGRQATIHARVHAEQAPSRQI